MKMTRLRRFILSSLLVASVASAQDADVSKAAQEAFKAGDLAKAKQFCEAWAEKKPTDERPYLMLGRVYLKLEMIDRALEQLEMAREVNPLNPEPICEVGKIFLEAGKPEEAIVEFESALLVRKDYGPALKALAEAKALLENPYANGVRVKLGEINDERGLKQLRAQRGRVVTIGGRQCKAIDIAAHGHHLYFNVDDKYLFDVDLPVRVTVEYYDLGTRQFLVKYDSSDSGAHWHGTHKRSERINRTDTKTWKTHTFNLPDARFANRTHGADLALYAEREDLNVSSVHVVQGGLGVSVEPRIAVPGGTCTVTATVVDSQGPAPDGTPVSFSTDQGAIAAEVKTIAGQAKARFEAGAEAGEAAIMVDAGTCKRVVHIPVVHGLGNIVQRRLVLDRFDGKTEWRVGRGRPAQGTLEQLLQGGADGQPALRLTYHFGRDGSSGRVSLSQPMLMPGRPIGLAITVKQDGSRSVLSAEFVDATGQTHCYALGDMTSTRWRSMEQDIGQASEYNGGANDGRLHLPLRFQRLFLRPSYSRRARKAGESEICLRDLTVVTEAPESETVLLDIMPDRPDVVLHLGKGAALHLDLSNLTPEPLRARLQWSIADHENHVVAEDRADEIEIEAETRTSKDVALPLTMPGAYRARFTLQTEDQKEQPQRASLSKDIAFLLLRDITDLGISAAKQPMAKGVVARLNNQSDQAAQFNLSYLVLNEQKEVLRKGSLGQPNIEVKAGEVLECPLSLEGLEPGRYQVLLLFDMGDGRRFSKLLTHERFPDSVALTARVIDDAGKPIAGASVYAWLVRRPHPLTMARGRSIQEWETQTDEDGQYTLAEFSMPEDVDIHRLHVHAVAPGFIDGQRQSRLRSLLRSGWRAPRIRSMRLKRGLKLTGRVLGADGEPVPDARIDAVCGPTTPVRAVRSYPRITWYRPRSADPEGRFELFAVPDMSTDLIVYSSQWAAKRVNVPAGQQDAGDIQLEPGTKVSGTLLDEHGQPAAGYWVVAESTDRSSLAYVAHPIRVAAKTGPDGTFTLSPMKGQFKIWAPPSFAPSYAEARRHSPSPRPALVPQLHTFDGTPEQVDVELRAVSEVRVAGRVIDIDGQPAKRVGLSIYCIVPAAPSTPIDSTWTDEEGRYAFEGVPRGVKDVMISVPVTRPWKRGAKIYLRAKPLTQVKGEDRHGTLFLQQIDEDLLELDFQFQFWHPQKGFLDTSPKKEPKAPEE